MSEFFLDFRRADMRREALAADRLKHFEDIRTTVFNSRDFAAVIARDDDPAIWSPFRSSEADVAVLLAGRIALEPSSWQAARSVKGDGGLACKAIFSAYEKCGVAGLQELNGNFTVIVHDGRKDELFIVTDRAGVAPAFRTEDPLRVPVFSSSPDLLAAAIDASEDFDYASLAEFLSTGRLSFPTTYYRKIKSLEYASITIIKLTPSGPASVSTSRYFQFAYRGKEDESEESRLASDLAAAFRKSLRLRTQPEMGKSIVSLSGGLDSRTVLSACPPGMQTFCFLDQENFETRISRQIADACGAGFIPLHRDFEHYGRSAAAAMRINGGMGRFSCNHYLGFRNRLHELGMENLLTGCYCDYFFKGVTLNKRIHPLFRTYESTGFAHRWYLPIYQFESAIMPEVTARIEGTVPESLRNKTDNASMFEIEARRLLPMCYEPDMGQRVIPQRVLRWSAPIADIDMIDIYCRTPYKAKLNHSMFIKMVIEVCDPKVSRIKDSNTGSPVNAWPLRKAIDKWRRAIGFKIEQKLPGKMVTTGSWPNWDYYIAHSKQLQDLWTRPNATARAVLPQILGYDPFERPLASWIEKGQMELISRLITLKVWFDVRIRAQNDPGPQ